MERWKRTKLGPDFRITDWEALKDNLHPERYDEKWKVAIDGIHARFNERFVKPADAIQEKDRDDPDQHYPEGRGFAIVALDCLLLESLYGYGQGKHTGERQTGKAFEHLLVNDVPFAGRFPKHLASSFAKAVRHGLLHDGETRHGWLIWQRPDDGGDAIVEDLGDGRFALYRDNFHAAVKSHLEEYFQKLRKPGEVQLRSNFRTRVQQLCDESKPGP